MACFFDGRYFELVLRSKYSRVLEPLYLYKTEDRLVPWRIILSSESGITLVRVCLVEAKHSTLVFVNFQEEKAWWWPCVENGEKINYGLVVECLKTALGVRTVEILSETVPELRNKNCARSGYCNLFVIAYALAWLNREEFSPSKKELLSLKKEIVGEYILPQGLPEEEYGLGGSLFGGLGGALVGGAVGGSTGAIVGGLGGSLLGAGVFSKEDGITSYSRNDAC